MPADSVRYTTVANVGQANAQHNCIANVAEQLLNGEGGSIIAIAGTHNGVRKG